MKYLVELKFTNPSHEHISLRRRVDTVTRLVEATNEDQAVLRASQQQRALGFFIKEAKVVKEKSHDKESGEETLIAKGEKVMKKAKGEDDKDEADAEKIEEKGGTASYPLLKPGQKLKPMQLKMGEEVEEVDEAKKPLKPTYWKAEWRLGTQSEVDKNNKKIFDKLAKTDPVKAAAFHDNLMRMKKKDVKEEVEQIDEVGDTAKGRAALDSYVKKKHDQYHKNRMIAKTQKQVDWLQKDANKNLARAEKRLDAVKSEEVEQVNEADREMNIARAIVKNIGSGKDYDKRDAGYKMSPAVRAAQKKSDELSKVVKRPQAGTLAAAKMREETEQVEEGVMKNLKQAQAKWSTAHRAVYGKDPTKKSMLIGAAARLLGAKPRTARAVSTTLAGKPVSKQQRAAAVSRAGKSGMASMKREERGIDKSTHKTRKAAEKMIKKAKGRVNKINMAPEIEVNKQEGK